MAVVEVKQTAKAVIYEFRLTLSDEVIDELLQEQNPFVQKPRTREIMKAIVDIVYPPGMPRPVFDTPKHGEMIYRDARLDSRTGNAKA